MNGATALTVLDNFLGVELKTEDAVEQTFRQLSAEQVICLVQEFQAFDTLWAPSESFGPETMNIGRAYDTFRNPLSWVPKYCEIDKHLDAKFVSRLLLYYPRISVWTPEMKDTSKLFTNSADDRAISDACALARRLVAIRPLLEDGSVQIVPDSAYARLCGWQKPPSTFDQFRAAILKSPRFTDALKMRARECLEEDDLHLLMNNQMGLNFSWIDDLEFQDVFPAGKILQSARNDASRQDLRAILDQIDFIPDRADFCSDSRYIWGLENAEQIRYVNPLNEINEDVLIQRQFGCSALCANNQMLQLMKVKYSGELASERDMVWENVSIALPALNDISQSDLIKVRQSEDCFQMWRDSLTRALRTMENQLAKSTLTADDVRNIFREQAQPAAVALDAKLKTTPLSAIARSAGVSFISGAAAGLLLNPDPATAVATGAISSLIKGTYDVLDVKRKRKEEPLVRLFSAIT